MCIDRDCLTAIFVKTTHYSANHVQSYHGVVTKIKNSGNADRPMIFRDSWTV